VKLRLGLVVVVTLVGCKGKTTSPPPPEVSEVRIVYRGQETAGAPKLDQARLTQVARTAITSGGGLPVREDGGAGAADKRPRYKLRVELEIGAAEDESSQRGNLRALVMARLSPIGAAAGALSFEQTALAEREFVVGAPGEPAWQAHAERAVQDCVGGVGARVKLASGDARALTAAIDGADDDLRDEAMRLAGDRREGEAVPALIRRLKGEDRAVRDRALGTLATIGDRRAVRPLTEVAKFQDVIDLPKVLDALATIGGPEARAYIEFVASGHESSEIRDLAKQALVHLDRREAERQRDLGAPSRPER
jgi:HEAT repeat protein